MAKEHEVLIHPSSDRLSMGGTCQVKQCRPYALTSVAHHEAHIRPSNGQAPLDETCRASRCSPGRTQVSAYLAHRHFDKVCRHHQVDRQSVRSCRSSDLLQSKSGIAATRTRFRIILSQSGQV